MPVVEPMSFKKNFEVLEALSSEDELASLDEFYCTGGQYLISECLRDTKLSDMTMSFEALCLPSAAPFSPTMYTLLSSCPSTALRTRISLFYYCCYYCCYSCYCCVEA